MVVIDNRRYLVNHGESHTYSLHILSLIAYAFEYLFGAWWLFVIANILLLSIHPLLVIVISKPSGGEGLVQDTQLSS